MPVRRPRRARADDRTKLRIVGLLLRALTESESAILALVFISLFMCLTVLGAVRLLAGQTTIVTAKVEATINATATK